MVFCTFCKHLSKAVIPTKNFQEKISSRNPEQQKVRRLFVPPILRHYFFAFVYLQTPFKNCHSDEKFSGENFITESRIAKSQ
jgi:hypothetical protein